MIKEDISIHKYADVFSACQRTAVFNERKLRFSVYNVQIRAETEKRADSNAGMCEISDCNTLQIIYDLHLNELRLTIFRFRQSNHDIHLIRASTAFAAYTRATVIKVIQLCNA